MEEIVKINSENQIELADSFIDQLKNFEKQKIEMELKEKQLKEELLEAMKKYNISSWATNDGSIKAVYKLPYSRTTIDSKRLKDELPDIAEEYSKTTNVSESVSLSIEV